MRLLTTTGAQALAARSRRGPFPETDRERGPGEVVVDGDLEAEP